MAPGRSAGAKTRSKNRHPDVVPPDFAPPDFAPL
jgi:hypothetical protein